MAFEWRESGVDDPGPVRRGSWPDKGYRYPRCRRILRGRGIRCTIPMRSDQRRRRFDPDAYRRRNVVERCVGRLKQFRGIATRYEKRAANFRAMVVIASLVIWLGT
jgi:transposase